jgi:capsular polysaccharide biosynthesis protein
MEERIRIQEDIGLSDIFRILLRKIKILIVALLLGAIIGGGIGLMKTRNVHYYGTSVDFYVNPKTDETSVNSESQYGVYGAYGQHVMDNMTKLLSSDIFAEKLFVDEYGLPSQYLPKNAEEKAKIQELNAAAKPLVITAREANNATAVALAAYEEALEIDTNIKAVSGKGYSETEIRSATDAVKTTKEALASARAAEKVAEDAATEAVNASLNYWGRTSSYQSLISSARNALEISYYDTAASSEEDLAKSFIYVKISVLNDKDFAELLLDRILVILPEYVEANMAVPTGYIGTNCQKITRLDKVTLLNDGYALKTAIKYALILCAAAFVVACITVVVIDRSNKKLRDYERTMENFKIPVLGVIPTISKEHQTNHSEVQQ